MTTGNHNSGFGLSSLYNTTTGQYNAAFGNYSAKENTTGSQNAAFGYYALNTNTTGATNTALGSQSGAFNTSGNGNVFIGYAAGNNSNYVSASNKLVVANSNTTTPLIDGDFSASTLKINGSLSVTGSMTMSVANTITSSTTYNGNETIIPINGANLEITIDTDQLVKGRVLTFKNLINQSYTILTEGSEQIQNFSMDLSDNLQVNVTGQTLTIFSDGSNWYPLGYN